MIIRIERYYNHPDLKRQTPQGSLQWKDFTFTEEPVEACDYLVILEYPKNEFSVTVNPNNIIHICSEPPNEISKYRQYANKKVALIFNQLDIKKNNVLSLQHRQLRCALQKMEHQKDNYGVPLG